jgi:ABC-type transporter Mla MlaB component
VTGMPPFSFTDLGIGTAWIDRFGAHVRISLAGEFDRSNDQELARFLHASLDSMTSTVQIDSAGITFADASFLRCLVSFARGAATSSVIVSIDAAAHCLRQTLAQVGLLRTTSFGVANELFGEVAQLDVLVLGLFDEELDRLVGTAADGAHDDSLGLLDRRP